MPSDDYSAAVSGGLKLKGVNSSSKISKHKKKNVKAEASSTELEQMKDENKKPAHQINVKGDPARKDVLQGSPGVDALMERTGDTTLTPTPTPQRPSKTDAELRHEERRRKRLDERLKREGTKTHKERVEELNRYLSNLSEHHDMPRIGPG